MALEPLTFFAPAPLDAKTGGYEYDRQLVAALGRRGVDASLVALDRSYPRPTAGAAHATARALAALPDDALVVVDGLAYAAMPEEAAREARRLRFVALVHHPLAEETGLDAASVATFRELETRALSFARLVVVTSQATARRIPSFGVSPQQIAVVEPGTAKAPLAIGSQGGGAAPGSLLCVSTLIPRKGHDVLLQALAQLRTLPWHLTCVGSADLDATTASAVRRLATELGLDHRVTFTGALSPDEVARHYHVADLLVMPTYHEGYGMAVAEALARGVPVVATPTGAIPDLVGTDAGLLVPPGDVLALVEALRSAMTDEALMVRLRAGARHVRDRLPTWDDAAVHFLSALAPAARALHGNV
jgi:glycosyltransferase involved in cell wall biosynthesis